MLPTERRPVGRTDDGALTPAARALALEHASNVIGVPADALDLDEALLRRVFRELSRTPEIETPLRDSWGNWDFSFGESNLRGELYTPWLDQPLAALRGGPAGMGAEPPEPAWPEGKPFALCLTHDVDIITLNASLSGSVRMVRRDLGLLLRGRRDPLATPMQIRNVVRGAFLVATLRWLRPRPERTYDEWIKLEDRHGFRSTFFFFPERVSRPHVYDCLYRYDDPMMFDGRRLKVRDVMRELVRSGWDVGLHGSYHSALERGLLGEQKRQIEDVIEAPVRGTRQHWLHYDVRVTPRLQAEAGLEADSTQGFNRNVGFRAGTAFPYCCWDLEAGRPLSVLEVPQHVMDGGLFTANALEYDVDRAVKHCVHLMDQVQAVGGCLTLSWHPNNIQLADYWTVYETVLAEAARRGAWGCSMGQLQAWWTERTRRIAARRAAAAQI
jgi:peptidoglycan/xylan/chitin deacetylase (PgdA/CDA1 family)